MGSLEVTRACVLKILTETSVQNWRPNLGLKESRLNQFRSYQQKYNIIMKNGISNKYRKLVNKQISNARTSGIHQTVGKKNPTK